jgi:hypothetical protein
MLWRQGALYIYRTGCHRSVVGGGFACMNMGSCGMLIFTKERIQGSTLWLILHFLDFVWLSGADRFMFVREAVDREKHDVVAGCGCAASKEAV